MRLAEDRILSFVSVFSTGYGTKWIPGCTFYYQPEIRYQTLLTQRRRWINGTFAAFIYFFASKRASHRVKGGFFDSHKPGKNIRFVSILWGLQLIQLFLVIISPTVFGSLFYLSLGELAEGWSSMHWLTDSIEIVSGIYVNWQIFFLGLFLAIYVVWSIYSYRVPRGVVPEYICWLICAVGFMMVLPVYYTLYNSRHDHSDSAMFILVLFTTFVPVLLAFAQSFTCMVLYLAYLPWFLVLVVFFLVFVPSYSFARVWDTTWGNRDTGPDSEINNAKEIIMKNTALKFITFNIFLNLILCPLLCALHRYVNKYVYFIALFFPVIIQLICSFTYLFILTPLRVLNRGNIRKNEIEE